MCISEIKTTTVMDIEICGRKKEIKEIYDFISRKIGLKQSGVLYITGPPGTGKSMSISKVIDKFSKKYPCVALNCYRAKTPKVILQKLSETFNPTTGLKSARHFSGDDKKKVGKTLNDSAMIEQLAKKFSSRLSAPAIILLDEIDQFPKSAHANFIKTVFSWANLPHSKLIVIGIANTVNLTSRFETFSSILSGDDKDGGFEFHKIVFRPYESKDIQEILEYYLKNDPTFEDANVEPSAIMMISKKYARESGDIRNAINALHAAVDDAAEEEKASSRLRHDTTVTTTEQAGASNDQLDTSYPTPPPTPPLQSTKNATQVFVTPCKDKTNTTTNLNRVVSSARKRQRASHYSNDELPSPHQIILTCLFKLCSKSRDQSVDSAKLQGKIMDALHAYNIQLSGSDYNAGLDHLEAQGFLGFKKRGSNGHRKIVLMAGELEIDRFVKHKETIMEFINKIV